MCFVFNECASRWNQMCLRIWFTNAHTLTSSSSFSLRGKGKRFDSRSLRCLRRLKAEKDSRLNQKVILQMLRVDAVKMLWRIINLEVSFSNQKRVAQIEEGSSLANCNANRFFEIERILRYKKKLEGKGGWNEKCSKSLLYIQIVVSSWSRQAALIYKSPSQCARKSGSGCFIVDEISFFVVRQTMVVDDVGWCICKGEEEEEVEGDEERNNKNKKSLSRLPARCLISRSPFLRLLFDFVESMSMDIAPKGIESKARCTAR